MHQTEQDRLFAIAIVKGCISLTGGTPEQAITWGRPGGPLGAEGAGGC